MDASKHPGHLQPTWVHQVQDYPHPLQLPRTMTALPCASSISTTVVIEVGESQPTCQIFHCIDWGTDSLLFKDLVASALQLQRPNCTNILSISARHFATSVTEQCHPPTLHNIYLLTETNLFQQSPKQPSYGPSLHYAWPGWSCWLLGEKDGAWGTHC